MPRKTVLDITQRILSALDYDPVNSINDTTESKQVAIIVKNCYRDIAAELELSLQGQLISLDDATDTFRPVMLKIPPDVSSVEWINYGIGESILEDTAPVLSIIEENETSISVEWTAALFGDGQVVSSYTLYRVSDGGLSEDQYDELTDFTEVPDVVISYSVDGDILTYEDTGNVDTASRHYAYRLVANGASGGAIESNSVTSTQPS